MLLSPIVPWSFYRPLDSASHDWLEMGLVEMAVFERLMATKEDQRWIPSSGGRCYKRILLISRNLNHPEDLRPVGGWPPKGRIVMTPWLPPNYSGSPWSWHLPKDSASGKSPTDKRTREKTAGGPTGKRRMSLGPGICASHPAGGQGAAARRTLTDTKNTFYGKFMLYLSNDGGKMRLSDVWLLCYSKKNGFQRVWIKVQGYVKLNGDSEKKVENF
jgi:hypothetical protein